jgi:hypothetical protein
LTKAYLGTITCILENFHEDYAQYRKCPVGKSHDAGLGGTEKNLKKIPRRKA